MRISDWSSDVCSSDLAGVVILDQPITVSKYATVAPVGTLDGVKKPGLFFTVSGYGISHLAKSGATVSFRIRLMATSTLGNLNAPYNAGRSEERQGGQGGVRTCKSLWSPTPKKK